MYGIWELYYVGSFAMDLKFIKSKFIENSNVHNLVHT